MSDEPTDEEVIEALEEYQHTLVTAVHSAEGRLELALATVKALRADLGDWKKLAKDAVEAVKRANDTGEELVELALGYREALVEIAHPNRDIWDKPPRVIATEALQGKKAKKAS